MLNRNAMSNATLPLRGLCFSELSFPVMNQLIYLSQIQVNRREFAKNQSPWLPVIIKSIRKDFVIHIGSCRD